MNPSMLISAARDCLSARGWVQGAEISDDGRRVCALMAVRMAGCRGNAPAQVTAAALSALGEVATEIAGKATAVPIFNDGYCHDIDDVLAWFDKAAAKLAEQGR